MLGERHLASANSLTSIDSQREEVIKINVGGTLFHTSPGTLLNKSNHTHGFLTDLVARALNQDHPVFLDRDPEYFRVALNYLRTGRLVLPAGMSSVLMSAELAFCGIAEPPVSVGKNFFRLVLCFIPFLCFVLNKLKKKKESAG